MGRKPAVYCIINYNYLKCRIIFYRMEIYKSIKYFHKCTLKNFEQMCFLLLLLILRAIPTYLVRTTFGKLFMSYPVHIYRSNKLGIFGSSCHNIYT